MVKVSQKIYFNQEIEKKIDSIYKLTKEVDDNLGVNIYQDFRKIILKYNKIKQENSIAFFYLYEYIEQYIHTIEKLLSRYYENGNKNFYNVNNFINFYVTKNLDYKYSIFKEFKDMGLIEERSFHKLYFSNSFKKILQVLSATYKKNNKKEAKTIYENSKINEIQQKAKEIVKFIIELNKKSNLINQVEVIKPTTTAMEITFSLSDSVIDNEEGFKDLIDKLYKLFWDNSQKIREYAKNNELHFINSLRTYYRHDIDHGDAKKIKNKYIKIRDFYKEACGKIFPESAKDWQQVQECVYDKLIAFLSVVQIEEISITK